MSSSPIWIHSNAYKTNAFKNLPGVEDVEEWRRVNAGGAVIDGEFVNAKAPTAFYLSKGVDLPTAKELQSEYFNKEYGGGMSKAELQDFDTLISRLEASKMKQAGQGNRARQRATFAGGLSSMMRNF